MARPRVSRLVAYLRFVGRRWRLRGLFVVATRVTFNIEGACFPDGSFNAGYNSYNFWSTCGIFQITLGFGELSFSTVKLIDVVWDVVVGRGGQAFLAYISYQVSTKALMRSMEHDPVPYGTFEAVTLQNVSLIALLKLARNYLRNKGTRARTVVAWIIVSAAFVLAFPTLTSAMSGYSANGNSYVNIDENYVAFSEFRLIRYIIHDGWRIGLDADHLVTSILPSASETALIGPILRAGLFANDLCVTGAPGNGPFLDGHETNWIYVPAECMLLWHVSEYVSEHGFLGKRDSVSTFNRSGQIYDLGVPILNVSAYCFTGQSAAFEDYYSTERWEQLHWYDFPFAFNWTDPTTGARPYQNTSNVAFTYSGTNQIYDLTYVHEYGSCQPSTTYKWGFSYLLLFVVVLLSTIWATGTYALWIDAYCNSRFEHAHRKMSMHRAILEAAAAMRKDMGENSIEVEDVSDDELKDMIERGLHGNKVGYNMLNMKKLPLSRGTEIRFWWRDMDMASWASREKWWLIAWTLTLASTVSSGLRFLWALFPTLFLCLGITLAIAIGRKSRSRWLIPATFTIVGLLLIPAIKRQAEVQYPGIGSVTYTLPNGQVTTAAVGYTTEFTAVITATTPYTVVYTTELIAVITA